MKVDQTNKWRSRKAVGKAILAFSIALCSTVQVAYLSPYENPYNQIQYVQEYKAMTLDTATPVDYTGDVNYAAKVSQFNYTDVFGQAKIAAAQLAVFDVSKGSGNRKFSGASNVTNIEALTMLVRMFGNDAQIRTGVLTQNPGASASKLTAALNDAYYAEAKRLGILTANEEVAQASPAQREAIGSWLVRASGLTATFSENGIYAASDWKTINTENLAAIETLLDLGMMKLNSKNQFLPKAPMTRQDFAVMLDTSFEQFSDILGIENRYGIVIGKKDSVDPTGTATDIYVRNVDNTVSHIQLKKPTSGQATGLVVYRNGLTSQANLALGDEIEYLIKDGVVRMTTVLTPGQVKDRLLIYFKTLTDVQTKQGTIKSVMPERLSINGLNQSNVRVRIENDDDTMVDLLSITDNNMMVINQFLLMNGSTYLNPASLQNESRITYTLQGDKVLYAAIGKSEVTQVNGTLRYVDTTVTPAQLVLFDNGNGLHIHNVARDAEVSVNYNVATLKDLKPGAPTSIMLINNEVVSITSDSYQPLPGYIPENGKIRMATVQSVSGNKVLMKDDTVVYEIGPATGVFKDEKAINLMALKSGDKVKLYFDNIYTNVPSKVVVEGKEQLITKILKGQVYSYNQFTNQLSISNRSRLQNTLWSAEADPATAIYKLASNVVISDNGKIISPESLGKSYIQKNAYFVIRDNFGAKEIVQLAFSTGSERNFKESVKSYSNVLNRLVLNDNRTIQYDNNTIFVKDQRVVDKTALSNKAAVHVVSNVVNGADMAQVIHLMSDVDTVFDRIFVGALDEVYSYSFNLANYSSPQDLVWAKVNQSQKLLNMTDDTAIYNLTTAAKVTREQLFNGAFSRSENDSKDGVGLAKERYYGVYVTEPGDGSGATDMVVGMAIRFKELIKNNNIDDTTTSEVQIAGKLDTILQNTTFTMGTVGEINTQWSRIGLVDSANYQKFHGEWTPNASLTYVEMKEALLIKGDKVVQFDDLAVDDRLYIVRDDEDALVVFVSE